MGTLETKRTHLVLGIGLVCILALAVAPSRFGVAVLALYALLHFSLRRSNVSRKAYALSGLVHQVSKVILVLLPVAAVVLLLNLELSNDGTNIRIGHLRSVYDEFASRPAALSFGFGAGSTFYSEGFQEVTDNIELSQFEILRKYGLFGLTVLIVYIAAAAARARAIEATVPLAEAIACYFLVAMSNPVLLTFGAMLLYGAAWSSERPVPSERRIAEAAP